MASFSAAAADLIAATTAIKAGFAGALVKGVALPLLEVSIVAGVTGVVLDGSFALLEAEAEVVETVVTAAPATGTVAAAMAVPATAAVLVELEEGSTLFSAVSRGCALKNVNVQSGASLEQVQRVHLHLLRFANGSMHPS